MRIFTNNIILFTFIMLLGMSGYAEEITPPQPAAAANGVPPPPGEPIDENLILLGFVALSFGLYTIYKPIKKASTQE
jgi:hypothetical protein